MAAPTSDGPDSALQQGGESADISASGEVEHSSNNVIKSVRNRVFTENFSWVGNHAAVVDDGAGTSVWWQEDSWSVRSDTSHNSFVGAGQSVDVRRARSANARDAVVEHDGVVPGGDGSPGIGVMHLDFEGILSARLRNPMVISRENPGVVEFFASRFVTTGHWWEVAISPTSVVTAGEYTAVPDANEQNGLPGALGSGVQPGSGHSPANDSINLVSLGASDVPCNQSVGWRTRFAITSSLNGVRRPYFNQVSSYQDLVHTDPSEEKKLNKWRIVYRPSGIDLFGDLDDDGEPEFIETFDIDIPWREVHVQFLGVGYQADHHPGGACFLGQVRDIEWRNISVYPVKYADTATFPKGDGVVNLPRQLGWLNYDLRDTKHRGTVRSLPQPNTTPYNRHTTRLYCRGSVSWPCAQRDSVALDFEVPRRRGSLAKAILLYDVRKLGTLEVAVNGHNLGAAPSAATVPGRGNEGWAQRSIEVPVEFIQQASNKLVLTLRGSLELDRLQMEFYYR